MNDTVQGTCSRCGYKTSRIAEYNYREEPRSPVNRGLLCDVCFNAVIIEMRKTESTSTPSTPSTPRYTTRSWGFFDKEGCVYAEQVTQDMYICNVNGGVHLLKVSWEPAPENEKKKVPILKVEDVRYRLPDKLYDVNSFYETPNIATCQAFISGTYKPRPLNQIVQELLLRIKSLFEFTNDRDAPLWVLFIIQSYLKPVLNNFFFAGVDATKGGGKTTLLEIMSYLSRHGYLGGDVSAASLPRMVEEFDLALFLDELDQRLGKTAEEDSVGVLRKGQRRGNYYVRLGKNDLALQQFDVAGTHAFSFRSELEDAFISRSLITHTAEAKDAMLPVINIFKKQVLQSIRDELFFWSVQEMHNFNVVVFDAEDRLRELVEGCSGVEGCSSISGHQALREMLYNLAMSDFSKEEKALFGTLMGRNIELCYLLLRVSRLAGLNFQEAIGVAMQEKQEDEAFGDNAYLDVLRDLLRMQYDAAGSAWVLREGETPGAKFVPKTMIYRALCQELKENNIPTIGSKRFNGLLRDLGFVQGISIRSQRPPGQTPKPCLIFTDDVLLKLGVARGLFI